MPFSTMQDYPLTLRPILAHGRTVHANSKVITYTGDGYVESTFAAGRRPCRPACRSAHPAWACEQGDRVGTFMWNNQTHLEAYLAVPCMGCRAAHLEHPAVPRPAGLRHQPRRGSSDHRRCLGHPAAGQGSRPAHHGRAHHREGRRRHLGARPHTRLRHVARRRAARLRRTPISTNAPAWPCATRAAPPATRRA